MAFFTSMDTFKLMVIIVNLHLSCFNSVDPWLDLIQEDKFMPRNGKNARIYGFLRLI